MAEIGTLAVPEYISGYKFVVVCDPPVLSPIKKYREMPVLSI